MARDILSFCLGNFIWDVSKGDVDQSEPWLQALHKEQSCYLPLGLDLAVVINSEMVVTKEPWWSNTKLDTEGAGITGLVLKA